jgi:hypothetical protein
MAKNKVIGNQTEPLTDEQLWGNPADADSIPKVPLSVFDEEPSVGEHCIIDDEFHRQFRVCG